MAFVTTNYGLVYNDSGDLCVTIKQDDVPFPRTKSIQIEESTTNLFPFDFDGNWVRVESGNVYSRYFTTVAGIQNVPVQYYGYQSSRTGNYKNVGQIGDGIFENGAKLTFSCYARGDGTTPKMYVIFWNTTQNKLLATLFNKISISNKWEKYTTTITLNTTGHNNGDNINIFYYGPYTAGGSSDSTTEYTLMHLEKKTYPTSFTVGTRQYNGRMIIPVKLKTQDEFVLNFWYKTNFNVNTNNSSSNDIYLLKNSSENYHQGLTEYNSTTDENQDNPFFHIKKPGVLRTNSSYDFLHHHVQIGTLLKDKQFHMITSVFTTNNIKTYIDGVLKWTTPHQSYSDGTNTVDWEYEELIFGCTYNGLKQTIIQDLFIGKYKDENGNIIWTDDFIRKIYETKKPFVL